MTVPGQPIPMARNHRVDASLYSARHTTCQRLSGEHDTMIDSRSDRLHDLARLRREWVAAYRTWTQVAADKPLTSTNLTDEQQAALRRYRAAETTYFTRLRSTTDRPQDK